MDGIVHGSWLRWVDTYGAGPVVAVTGEPGGPRYFDRGRSCE